MNKFYTQHSEAVEKALEAAMLLQGWWDGNPETKLESAKKYAHRMVQETECSNPSRVTILVDEEPVYVVETVYDIEEMKVTTTIEAAK